MLENSESLNRSYRQRFSVFFNQVANIHIPTASNWKRLVTNIVFSANKETKIYGSTHFRSFHLCMTDVAEGRDILFQQPNIHANVAMPTTIFSSW